MKESTINVGDRVLQCTTWKPGEDYSQRKKLGEGIVTLIATNEIEQRRTMRVLWTSGVVDWHPEEDLVAKSRVFGSHN